MPRIHSYQQLEHSDCGITCVRMIARFYGKRISTEYLRNLCDMSRLGISIGDVVSAFRALGMESVAASVLPSELPEMPLPAVLCWEQKHFVVLYKIKGNKYYIADPACGKMTLDKEEFFRCWLGGANKGIAILADSTEAFEQKKFDHARTNSRLFFLIKNMLMRHKTSFSAIILLGLIALLGDIAMPLIFQHTIDEGIMGKDISLIWLLIFSQLLIFIGNYIGQSIVDIILTKLGLNTGIEMMDSYLRKLVRLPMVFFERKVNSDLIQKAEEQSRIRSFLTTLPDTYLFTTLSLLVFAGLLIYLNYKIFILLAIMTTLGCLWSTSFLRRRREIDFSYTAALAENRNNLYELVHGMIDIKINNAQRARIDNWMQVQERVNHYSIKNAFLNLWISGGVTLLDRLRDIAITGFCAILVVNGKMSIGEMMTISYIAGRISAPFNKLINSITNLQNASISYARLEEVLSSEEENSNLPVIPQLENGIRFENVSFKYPGSRSPIVLKNINFSIPRGKITALVGASGSGKTTLIKLIMGMFHAAEGNILIDNCHCDFIGNEFWTEKIGVVMQNPTIFSDTILGNIALSDNVPDRNKATDAAKLACLDEFIAGLPMGYDTRIGVAGIEMSGGQKQRLMIARAIYKNPEILILDEATSNLDAGTEADIIRNLNEFYRGRTVIIAAHRLSTVKHADNIIFLEKGEIKEEGSHLNLIEKEGYYYNLVRNQLELR